MSNMTNVTGDDFNQIISKFMCAFSFKSSNWIDIKEITWEGQKSLFDRTINHEIVRNYPINYVFQETFLKMLIKCIESQYSDVLDEMYESYCEMKENTTLKVDYFYKHYFIDGKVVSIKERPEMISNGTTGLHMWEGALVLSEWCLNNSDMFNDKTVLELGSGTGLSGIIMSKFCKTKRTILTDAHGEVLKLLSDNVHHNCSTELDNGQVKVLDLPWERIPESNLSEIDFVIASDIIYDPTDFDALIKAFITILNDNRHCTIIMACTIRNEDTLNRFISLIGSNRMKLIEYEQPTSNHFNWPSTARVKLIGITL